MVKDKQENQRRCCKCGQLGATLQCCKQNCSDYYHRQCADPPLRLRCPACNAKVSKKFKTLEKFKRTFERVRPRSASNPEPHENHRPKFDEPRQLNSSPTFYTKPQPGEKNTAHEGFGRTRGMHDEDAPAPPDCPNCRIYVTPSDAQLECIGCHTLYHVGCINDVKKEKKWRCQTCIDRYPESEAKHDERVKTKKKRRKSIMGRLTPNIPNLSKLPKRLFKRNKTSSDEPIFTSMSPAANMEEPKHPGTNPSSRSRLQSKHSIRLGRAKSQQVLRHISSCELTNIRCHNEYFEVTKINTSFSCERAEMKECGTPVLIKDVSVEAINDNNLFIPRGDDNVCEPFAWLGMEESEPDEPEGTYPRSSLDGSDPDTIKIVREDVCDMQDWLNAARDEEIHTNTLLDICGQMTHGLCCLHQHGIKHRNISLRNFLIRACDDDSPKQHSDTVEICDYGLRRRPLQRKRSAIEVVCFDVYYFRSDVYSFGIALWELFSRGEKMDIFDNMNDDDVRKELLRNSSVADLLDMKQIPLEIARLIRRCTMMYRGRRPSMESIEEYIKDLLRKGTLRPASGDYGGRKPTESEKIYEMFKNYFVDSLLKRSKEPKLKKVACRKMSRDNIRICKENGICTKKDLKDYLVNCTDEDFFYDGFVQVQEWDIVLRYLFDDEVFGEIQTKIRNATTLHDECTQKVEITLDRNFPTDPEEQYLFLHNTRQTCRTENLKTLVKDSMKKGSIKITLLATPENMEKLRKMLNDPESSLRAPGSIFASVDTSSIEISDADVFGSSSDNEEYKDSFGFGSLGFTEPQVRKYVKGFFDYGVYTTDELIEFFNMFDEDDGIMRSDMEEDFAEIVPPEDHRQKIRGLVMPKDPQEAAVAAGGPHSDDGGSSSKPNDDPFSIREEKTPSIESAPHTYVDNAPIYPKVSSNALDASDGWEKVCSCWKYQGRRHKPKPEPEPTQGTCHTAPVDFLGLSIPGRDLETDFHMDQAPLCDTYYGKNWLALEKATKRRVLLKRSDLGYAGEKISLRNHRSCSCDISQEIKILQYISSLPEPKPHFVGFIDAFHDFKDGKNWITVAMEYVDGYDLHKYINNKMPKYTNSDKEREATAKEREAKTRVIMGQILHAVSYLHSMGVVHRDLSLQNILISMDKDGHEIVKIIDFTWSCGGPGTKYYNADKWQAKTDPPVGNPRFMSPEAFNILSHDLLANDIWSCGIVFLVLLIGKFPYDTPYNNPAYQLIKSGDVRQLLHERTGGKFSDDCADLLQAMLRPEKNRIKMEDILTHSFWTPADHGRPVDITYTSKIPDKTGALKQAHEMGSRDKAAGIKGIYDFGEKDRSPRDVYAN